jgi:hypothetical protein
MPRHNRFNAGKETRYPLCRRLGNPQGRLDGCGKSRPHTVLDPWPVASRYINFSAFSFLISTSIPAPWPQCLRRISAAPRLLGLRVRIPPWAWVSVL